MFPQTIYVYEFVLVCQKMLPMSLKTHYVELIELLGIQGIDSALKTVYKY